MASQQEIYHSDTYTYATSVTDLGLTLSSGVAVTINESTTTGWAATATHVGLAAEHCGFFFGDANPTGADPATLPGTVVC